MQGILVFQSFTIFVSLRFSWPKVTKFFPNGPENSLHLEFWGTFFVFSLTVPKVMILTFHIDYFKNHEMLGSPLRRIPLKPTIQSLPVGQV